VAETTQRIEAFSDGVFAIAITLLVLEIKVPHADGPEALWHALAGLWPSGLLGPVILRIGRTVRID